MFYGGNSHKMQILNPLSAIRANICDGKFDLISVLDPYEDT